MNKNDPEVITFDKEAHKYYVNGVAMSESVTTVVHAYFSKFNGPVAARAMLRGRDFWVDEGRYGKYWEVAKELSEQDAIAAIISMWDEVRDNAATLGTAMHEAIEDYFVKGVELPDTKECAMFLDFKAHAESLGYMPYKFETIVWDTSASIAGSVDAMFINPLTHDIWLVDWKRSREIKMEGYRGAKGTGPLSDKSDCNYEHYSLQLNIYKYMLTRMFNERIVRMSIVVLHPDQEDYILLDVQDNQRAVEAIMKERREKYANSLPTH